MYRAILAWRDAALSACRTAGCLAAQVYVAKRDGAKNIFKQYLDSQGGELRVSIRALHSKAEQMHPAHAAAVQGAAAALLPAGGGVPKGTSAQLPRLQGLVQQARRELLLPDEQAAEQDAAAPGAGGAAAVYFDLSQVSPQLAAAAAEGLALL